MDVFTVIGHQYDSNIYVIHGKKPTVIDTGTGSHSSMVFSTIERFIEPEKIQQIILTHEHYDHVGGTQEFLVKTNNNAHVFAHANATAALQKGTSTFAALLGGKMPKITINHAFADNDTITVGDDILTVLHTPGHSPGSICLYAPESKQLFCGDTIFANGEFGRFDLPGGDIKALQQSVARVASLDVKKFYPGHGPIVEEQASQHLESSLRYVQSF